MKWYGLFGPFKLEKNLIRNYKRRLNLRSRSAVLVCNSRVNYHKFSISIYIPVVWKFLSVRNFQYPNLLFFKLFSETYFYNLIVPATFITHKYSPYSRCVNFVFTFYNNYINLYWFFFKLIFASLTQIFFNKLKFRGKGYYIYKNQRNTVAFQFGYSHRVRIFTHFIGAKLLSKITIFFFGINKFDILKASYLFFYKRPISIFTGKGVRFTRQVIYKKTGKISSYR